MGAPKATGTGRQERPWLHEKTVRRHFKFQFAVTFVVALVCAMSGQAFAVRHSVIRHARRHFRWLRWNPMFRPSHESLLIQNAEVDRLNLPRIQDETELEALKNRIGKTVSPMRPSGTIEV